MLSVSQQEATVIADCVITAVHKDKDHLCSSRPIPISRPLIWPRFLSQRPPANPRQPRANERKQKGKITPSCVPTKGPWIVSKGWFGTERPSLGLALCINILETGRCLLLKNEVMQIRRLHVFAYTVWPAWQSHWWSEIMRDREGGGWRGQEEGWGLVLLVGNEGGRRSKSMRETPSGTRVWPKRSEWMRLSVKERDVTQQRQTKSVCVFMCLCFWGRESVSSRGRGRNRDLGEAAERFPGQ